MVHVALLVAEGLGKQLDPDIDMIALAAPYLMTAMVSSPTPRPPNRPTPSSG